MKVSSLKLSPVNFSAAENYAEELGQSVIKKKYKKNPNP